MNRDPWVPMVQMGTHGEMHGLGPGQHLGTRTGTHTHGSQTVLLPSAWSSMTGVEGREVEGSPAEW